MGNIRAADFGTSHLRHYIAERRRVGAKNATINRELAIVKRAFRLAAQSDPPRVARVPHVPMLIENNVRKGFLEHTQYLKLRNELPEDLRVILVVGYHVGARAGELKALRWPQVDLKANRIRLEPGTKNREGRTLPAYGEMREWLFMQKEIRMRSTPRVHMFSTARGSALGISARPRKMTARRAGVPGLLFHDLRRTAVRNMVRAGIPEKVAMQISGHKTRSVLDRYNIVSERDLADAAAKMERHLDDFGTLLGTPANPAANPSLRKIPLSR